MENEFPSLAKLFPESETLGEIIENAARSGQTLERLRPEVYRALERFAPTIFAECTLAPIDPGYILVISPCKKHICVSGRYDDLGPMESFYKEHACEICLGVANRKVAIRMRPSTPEWVDTSSPEWIDGFASNIVIQSTFETDKWTEYAPGVFYTRISWSREPYLCVTTTGISMFVAINDLGIVVATHNEISAFQAKMKVIGANLPQPIAEALAEYYF